MIPIIEILRREHRNRLQNLPRQLVRMLRQEVDDPAPVRRPQQRHELGVAEPEGLARPGGFERVVGGVHGEVHDEFGFVGDDVVFELSGRVVVS